MYVQTSRERLDAPSRSPPARPFPGLLLDVDQLCQLRHELRGLAQGRGTQLHLPEHPLRPRSQLARALDPGVDRLLLRGGLLRAGRSPDERVRRVRGPERAQQVAVDLRLLRPGVVVRGGVATALPAARRGEDRGSDRVPGAHRRSGVRRGRTLQGWTGEDSVPVEPVLQHIGVLFFDHLDRLLVAARELARKINWYLERVC